MNSIIKFSLMFAITVYALNAHAIHGYIFESIQSKYVSSSGKVKTDNPVLQHYLAVYHKNCGASAWTNHDISKNALTELDLFVFCTSSLEDFSGGRLSVTVRGEKWMHLPYDKPDDAAARLILHYTGPFDMRLEWTQRMTTGFKLGNDGRLRSKVGKSFTLHNGTGIDLSLTPTVETAIFNNYFGESGLVYVTPGLNLNLKMENITFSLTVHQQFGLSSRENITYGGFNVKFGF